MDGATVIATGPTTKLTARRKCSRTGSWSPAVRERSAMALSARADKPDAAYGGDARVARHLRPTRCMSGDGSLLGNARRTRRAELSAMRRVGGSLDPRQGRRSARPYRRSRPASVPDLFEPSRGEDPVSDPRGMEQRYLSFALFEERHVQKFAGWRGSRRAQQSDPGRTPKRGRPRPLHHRRRVPNSRLRGNRATSAGHLRAAVQTRSER